MALIINLVIIFITGLLRGSIIKKGSQLKYLGSSTGTKALRTQMEKQAKDMERDYVRKDLKLCFLKFLLLCSLMNLWIQGRLSL